MTKILETRLAEIPRFRQRSCNHNGATRLNGISDSPIVSGTGAMPARTGFPSTLPVSGSVWLSAMNLDVNTLFLVTIYVEAILGLLLLFAWVQNTSIYAVAWWGFAHLLLAASVVLFGLYGSVPDLITIDLANALLFTAFAVTWTGARLFDHQKPLWYLMFGGAALWLVVCRLPGVAGSFDVRVLLSSGIITTYTWATAYEFWRGRSE